MTDHSVVFEIATLLCLAGLAVPLARAVAAIRRRSPRQRVAWWVLGIATAAVGSHLLALADLHQVAIVLRVAATGMFAVFVDEQLGGRQRERAPRP